MRPGQNKRMRGRGGNRKGPNPLTRAYESNGPDVKIRGTAHHVAEKYLQLARDAQSSGDPVMAENYLQHAEHYFRIIAAAQQAQQQAQVGYMRSPGEAEIDDFDEDDDGGIPDRFASPPAGFGQPGYGAPNGAQQPPYGQPPQQQQPYNDRGNFNPERQGQDRNYQDRGPRQDRPYQDRNGQNRNNNNQNRGPRDQRPQRDFRNDQPRTDMPRPEMPRNEPSHDPRPENRPPVETVEGTGLPAFITAPVRLPISETTSEPPLANGVESESDDMNAEAGGFHLRPRRRRRSRPPRNDGDANTSESGGEAKFPGEVPLGD
jgi:hypothetical protein